MLFDNVYLANPPLTRVSIQISDSSPRGEELPKHLTLHPFQHKGSVNQIIDSKWVGLKINELLVVEYYSRQRQRWVLCPCGDGATEVLRIQEKVTARRAVYHYDRCQVEVQ